MAPSASRPGDLHVVIVGAGIIGATIAFELCRRDVPLTVVDAGEPGRSLSAVSFSWINAADKRPVAYRDLNRRSLDMWAGFARRVGEPTQPTWGGELRWTATTAGGSALRERARAHSALGYPVRLLSRAEVVDLEPELTPGEVSAASHAELEGHVDADGVVASCLSHATGRGARLRAFTKVTGFHLERHNDVSRVEAVVLAGEEIACDVVVLATGASSAELATSAGLSLPLDNSFGATVLTEPARPLLRHVAVVQTARDLDTRVSIRQLGNGAVMLHGMADGVAGSLGRSDAEVRRVVDTATRFLPALGDLAVAEVRTGTRHVPSGGGHPVVGFSRAVPNLYIAVAHNAITLAPLLAELATREILEDSRVDLLEPYRMERFQNREDER